MKLRIKKCIMDYMFIIRVICKKEIMNKKGKIFVIIIIFVLFFIIFTYLFNEVKILKNKIENFEKNDIKNRKK